LRELNSKSFHVFQQKFVPLPAAAFQWSCKSFEHQLLSPNRPHQPFRRPVFINSTLVKLKQPPLVEFQKFFPQIGICASPATREQFSNINGGRARHRSPSEHTARAPHSNLSSYDFAIHRVGVLIKRVTLAPYLRATFILVG
jgi:hypothetical protein